MNLHSVLSLDHLQFHFVCHGALYCMLAGLPNAVRCDCPSAAWKVWNGNCYLHENLRHDFDEALDYCASQQSQLLTVKFRILFCVLRADVLMPFLVLCSHNTLTVMTTQPTI